MVKRMNPMSLQNRTIIVTGAGQGIGRAVSMVAQLVGRFGAVHGLVNNAGITWPAMIKKMTLDQRNDVVRVNQPDHFLCIRAVGRQMLEQAEAEVTSPGTIVNVSSNAGRKGSIWADQLQRHEVGPHRDDDERDPRVVAARRAHQFCLFRTHRDADDRNCARRPLP